MKKLIIFLLSVTFLLLCYSCIYPIYTSIDFPDNMFVTNSDLEYINNESEYSTFFKFKLPNDLPVDSEQVSATNMTIKLFGWLPIKKVKVKLLNDVNVIVGGNTVGFYLNSDGVVVVGTNPILTEIGNVEPTKESNLQKGDIIKSVNGTEISNIEDINSALNTGAKLDKVSVEILRDNSVVTLQVCPALDIFTNTYRLGLWVKNSASGVGTLTYIRESDNRFGAVGHPICNDIGESFNISTGNVYLCNYLGIKRGTKDSPGEIKTNIKLLDESIGIADTNCNYGVYGNINNPKLLDTSLKSSLGGRMSIKLGNAKIYCDIDGEGIKGYDIKIVKTAHQSQANDKSIMFRVTDKTLLEKTGGIIQGMSGSPIIQNDKLVGAVTHVFLNDPTKAFGVYIDWMIDN